MLYSIYNKPFKDSNSLLSDLKSKNLTIQDEIKAKVFLENINYYRFKIYLRPFLDLNTNTYLDGINFENAVKLYRFDDYLRDYLFSVIGRIEIKLRSKLDQMVTDFKGTPFWYLDEGNFSRNNNYQLLSDLSNKFLSSKEEFILHYKKNYYNDINYVYKHMPPFWMISELSTFGNILKIYETLDKNSFNDSGVNLLDKLAKEFGAYNLKELNNWLKFLRDLRNKCAHHSRVWNANYRAPSGLDHKLSRQPSNENRLYSIFVVLHIMIKSLGIQDIDMKIFIDDCINQSDTFKDKKAAVGFPEHWETDPFWS